ncbi:MAG TPA: hypothetical protein VEN81_15865 [Planctomycetota bacterium]|nr:hypothetical protein [Planctomycetota bacterium]
MKRLALCLLGLHLAMVPGYADVIPSKYDEKDPAQKQAVKDRLQVLGVSSSNAEHRVKVLDADELAYFAQNPERIQPAGHLYWYEWVIGAAVLAGITIFALSQNIKWP